MAPEPMSTAEMIESEEQGSFWAVVSDAMAGRWRLAIALGLVLGIVLGGLGYVTSRPMYTSTGGILVNADIDPLLEETIETQRIQDLNTFVQTQALRLNEQATLAAAVIDVDEASLEAYEDEIGRRFQERPTLLSELPSWQDDPDAALQRLASELSVAAGRGSSFIRVTYTAPDRTEARAAVQSVLIAYHNRYGRQWTGDARDKIGELRSRSSEIASELQSKRDRLDMLIQDEMLLGDPLSARQIRYEELLGVMDELRQLETLREARPSEADAEADGAEPVPADGGAPAEADDEPTDPTASSDDLAKVPEPTAIDLDRFDPTLASLRAGLLDLERRAREARIRYPAGAWQLQRVLRELEDARSQFEARLVETTARWKAEQADLLARGRAEADERTLLEAMDPERIEARIGELTARRTTLEAELRAITQKESEIEKLRAEMRQLDSQLASISERLRSLDIEASRPQFRRFEVMDATRPLGPSSDRRKQLAAAGFVGGLGLGLGLFFVIGRIDRRAYQTGQLRRLGRPYVFLGAVPDMSRRVTDLEIDAEALAAHCVHQVRNKLDAHRTADRALVLAVTSPEQGDGKTSLTAALASSYARAGFRTLAIDSDFTGAGLTTMMEARGLAGLREALQSGSLEGTIVSGPSESLDLMPVGCNDRMGPESIRTKDLGRMIESLRDAYDVVLLDTGPMPGSLESVPVASSVDGVVLTVRRGRQQSILDGAVDAIEDMGAPCLGVILNCALPSDCERLISVSAMSLPVEKRDTSTRARKEAAAGRSLVVAVRRAEADEPPDELKDSA